MLLEVLPTRPTLSWCTNRDSLLFNSDFKWMLHTPCTNSFYDNLALTYKNKSKLNFFRSHGFLAKLLINVTNSKNNMKHKQPSDRFRNIFRKKKQK